MIREHCSQIGVITRPHGIDGNVIVRLNGVFADDIEPGEPMFVEIDETLIPFFIEEIRPQGDTAFIKFEFVDSEPDAAMLRSKPLYAEANKFDTRTFALSSASLFKGYRIIDEISGFSATIDDFIDNPANPLFLTHIDNRDLYIPVHENFVLRINRRKKIIYMKLPEGLTEL